MPLWLSEVDVRAVLLMPDLVDAVESAFIGFSAGLSDSPALASGRGTPAAL
ncbi:MAG: hypothetical protein ABI759_26280 [Candidatus Solibacter sp.]